jgi:hypothetical protein
MHAAEFKKYVKTHDAKGSAYFDLRLKPFLKNLNYPIKYFFHDLLLAKVATKVLAYISLKYRPMDKLLEDKIWAKLTLEKVALCLPRFFYEAKLPDLKLKTQPKQR